MRTVEGASLSHILLAHITFPLKETTWKIFLSASSFCEIYFCWPVFYWIIQAKATPVTNVFKPLIIWKKRKIFRSYFKMLVEWHWCCCDTFHMKGKRKVDFWDRNNAASCHPLKGKNLMLTHLRWRNQRGKKIFWLLCSDASAFTSFQLDSVKPYNIQGKKPNQNPIKPPKP